MVNTKATFSLFTFLCFILVVSASRRLSQRFAVHLVMSPAPQELARRFFRRAAPQISASGFLES
jgi:hypothetical protein